MEELKKYLAPSLSVIELDVEVFTAQASSEKDWVDDPYGGDGGWWE